MYRLLRISLWLSQQTSTWPGAGLTPFSEPLGVATSSSSSSKSDKIFLGLSVRRKSQPFHRWLKWTAQMNIARGRVSRIRSSKGFWKYLFFGWWASSSSPWSSCSVRHSSTLLPLRTAIESSYSEFFCLPTSLHSSSSPSMDSSWGNWGTRLSIFLWKEGLRLSWDDPINRLHTVTRHRWVKIRAPWWRHRSA